MRKRVVITGMGAITPLGHNVEELFRAEWEGKRGVGLITLFDASNFPTTFASQVKNFDLGGYLPDPQRFDNSGVNTRFALAAAHQALGDAGLLDNSHIDSTRFGVYLGAGEGIQDFNNLIPLIARCYVPQENRVDTVKFVHRALREFHSGRAVELAIAT